ncbi:MAG: cupredoxin domain-containing protein [Bacteroidota bacterium]
MSRRSLLLLFIFMALAGGVLLIPLPARASAPSRRLVRVEASQFAYTPGTIHVEPGDLVTIELVSRDVVHGLYVDGYDISVTADPGQTARLTFLADRPGSFRFRCNVTCGAMHPFMMGKFTVGTNGGFLRAAGLAVLAALAVPFLPGKPD